MFKRTLLLFLFLTTPIIAVYSQVISGSGYHNDALRFSQTTFGGTARYLGIAGAQTALGGDIGSLSGNPAGLGFYRRSEFSISPSLSFNNASSVFTADASGRGYSYTPNSINDTKTNFNFSNLGIVFSNAKEHDFYGGWRGGSWGISLTRTNHFHNKFTYSGENIYEAPNNIYKEYSITDYFYNLSKDITPNELGTGSAPLDVDLAYNVYLLDTLGGNFITYPKSMPDSLLPLDIRQGGSIETSGAQYQTDIAYGGNYDDKIYIGGAIGIATIRYNETRIFEESAITRPGEPVSPFESLSLVDQLYVRGTGINARLGIIYRATDVIRIGGSVQTPTWYAVSEEYSSNLTANYRNLYYGNDNDGNAIYLNKENAFTDPSAYNYRLTTPFRANIGTSFFIGKNGFISTDVEYISYNTAKVKADDNDFANDNQAIKNIFKPSLNYRIGGEYRINTFRARLGAALYGDPYDKANDGINRQRIVFTGGIGIRLPEFYIDLAAVNTSTQSAFTPFVLESGANPAAKVKNNLTTVTVSFGSFF